MTLTDINKVSTREAVYANEYTKQLFKVFPKQIDFSGFSTFNIKLNDNSIIEAVSLLADNIQAEKLPEKLKYLFKQITQKYGSYNPSDTIGGSAIFSFDASKLMKELNNNPSGFICNIQNEGIKNEYKKLVENITMTIKADKDNTGFISAEFKFNNTSDTNVIEQNESDEDSLNFELLDEDDENTIYENESNYIKNVEPIEKQEEIIEKSDIEEIHVEPKSIQREKTIISEKQEKNWLNITKGILKEIFKGRNQFKISILNLVWSALMLIIWIGFLWEPITRVFADKQKGSWINSIYYIVYFIYTVLACFLPVIIKFHINKFAKTEKQERDALKTEKDFTTKEHNIWAAYKTTFFDKDFGITNKTRASADLYFNYESVANTMMPKFPVVASFKMIAGSFMGLGILGTFIGFATGLRNIDFSSTDTKIMLDSIEALVKNGLATAFNTSIVGVFCSLIYSFLIYNPLLLKLNKYFEELSDSLDKEFYVSETEALMQYTMLTDENAKNITFSQSLRFIVENMNKQTDALNHFSNDLADKIANINETVNTSLNTIATGVGTEVKDAVIENVHLEMDGLKLSLTDAAKQLGMVAEKISDTPELLTKANTELKQYLDDTRTSFSDMLNQNLEANRTALDEVVDTIQTELSTKFAEFNTSITNALENSKKAAELLSNVPEKLKYLEAVENGLTGILKDLNSAEKNINDVLASAKIHEENSVKKLTAVLERTNIMLDDSNTMLDGFRKVDVSLKNIFEHIGKEIENYNSNIGTTLKQYLSEFEKASKIFSSSTNGIIQEFEETLNDLSSNIANIQQTSNSFDESINKLAQILSKVN